MITIATVTNSGDREINEDSIGVFEHDGMHCAILCDGLGGHGKGEVASSIVVKVFEDQFGKADEMTNFLGETFMFAQETLLMQQKELKMQSHMKTTAVSVVTDDRNAYIGHVGDSRLYVFSKNKVKCRTIDHSIPQMLALSKQIKESEIRNHPNRNILLRVMGIEWEETKYELMAPIPLKKCQAFLLCSDGFWELIEEKEMSVLLKKSNTVQEWLQMMTEIVKANGSDRDMDNFSAIAIWNE